MNQYIEEFIKKQQKISGKLLNALDKYIKYGIRSHLSDKLEQAQLFAAVWHDNFIKEIQRIGKEIAKNAQLEDALFQQQLKSKAEAEKERYLASLDEPTKTQRNDLIKDAKALFNKLISFLDIKINKINTLITRVGVRLKQAHQHKQNLVSQQLKPGLKSFKAQLNQQNYVYTPMQPSAPAAAESRPLGHVFDAFVDNFSHYFNEDNNANNNDVHAAQERAMTHAIEQNFQLEERPHAHKTAWDYMKSNPDYGVLQSILVEISGVEGLIHGLTHTHHALEEQRDLYQAHKDRCEAGLINLETKNNRGIRDLYEEALQNESYLSKSFPCIEAAAESLVDFVCPAYDTMLFSGPEEDQPINSNQKDSGSSWKLPTFTPFNNDKQ